MNTIEELPEPDDDDTVWVVQVYRSFGKVIREAFVVAVCRTHSEALKAKQNFLKRRELSGRPIEADDVELEPFALEG